MKVNYALLTYSPKNLIKSITSWEKTVFNDRKSLYYYYGDADAIVEVEKTNEGFTIFTSGHNPDKTEEIVEGTTPALILAAYGLSGRPTRFLYDFRKKRRIASSDFCITHSDKKSKYLAICTTTDNLELGFPHVYVINVTSEFNRELLAVQIRCSHVVAPPVSKATAFGKEFAYMIVNSTLQCKFNSLTPNTEYLTFPSNDSLLDVAQTVQTPRLLKFIEDVEADKVTTNSTVVEGSVEDSDDEDDEMDDFIMTLEDANDILSSYTNMGTIPLSVVCMYTIEELEKLLSKNSLTRGILLELDISEVLKAGILIGDKIYGVPIYEDFSWADLTGRSDDDFVLCTDERFDEISALAKTTKKGD